MNDTKLLPTPPPPLTKSQQLQDDYLTNNWRQIQACDPRAYTDSRYVKMSEGIATICSRNLIIRHAPFHLRDGYYMIDHNNNFILDDPQKDHYYYERTRDIDVLRPNPEFLIATPPIYREEIIYIKNFCDYVAKTFSNARIMIQDNAFFVPSKTDEGITVSCQLPVNSEGLILEAVNLKLAFIEMMRYDYVMMWRDSRKEYVSAPLIVGYNYWTQCALVGPLQRGW